MYARLDSLHFKHEEFAAEMKTAQQHAQVVIPPATQEQLKKIENRL